MNKNMPISIHRALALKSAIALHFGLAVGTLAVVADASAALALRTAFQDAALSVDAFGSTRNSGTLQTDVPSGATVRRAFLYGSDVFGNGLNNVTLAGTLLAVGDGTLLGPNANPANTIVWDVTSIVKPQIEGTWGLQNHTITEAGNMDGETLVVVYEHSSTAGRTAIILDGELSSAADNTRLDFASPYTGGDVLMSLAITFGFQPSPQFTTVDVTTESTANRRLTSCAGGQDDGEPANGALITAGGIGDDPTNPNPGCSVSAGPRVDDELYNLALGNSESAIPFLNVGDTFLELNTRNPSGDDNVYAMFISSTARVTQVDDTPIDGNTVPEPASLSLLGLGLGLMSLARTRRRRS